MSESAIEEKIDQIHDLLKDLYGNFAEPATQSKKKRVSCNIKSGEGLTTIADFSDYRSQCVATTYNHINAGILPKTIAIGGRRYFKNEELLAMEESL